MRTLWDNLEEYLILLLLPSMTAVVLAATLARYTEWFSMFWGEELARYMMVYLGYLGIALAMKRQVHIGVTALTDKVQSRKGKRILLLFQTLIILLFCGVISKFLFSIIARQHSIGQVSPALEIPIWIPYAAVPLGMLLLAARACQVFREQWRKLNNAEGNRL
jgi:C4-dicarboxylate transporter DctQ subunit